MSILSLRKMYTGIMWDKRTNMATESPIFSFKIRKTMVPKQFKIKIRSGETGEIFKRRRTDRAKPHHENMKIHRGPIIFTQDYSTSAVSLSSRTSINTGRNKLLVLVFLSEMSALYLTATILD